MSAVSSRVVSLRSFRSCLPATCPTPPHPRRQSRDAREQETRCQTHGGSSYTQTSVTWCRPVQYTWEEHGGAVSSFERERKRARAREKEKESQRAGRGGAGSGPGARRSCRAGATRSRPATPPAHAPSRLASQSAVRERRAASSSVLRVGAAPLRKSAA
eukprot:1599665-Rhodomonas_salina.9